MELFRCTKLHKILSMLVIGVVILMIIYPSHLRVTIFHKNWTLFKESNPTDNDDLYSFVSVVSHERPKELRDQCRRLRLAPRFNTTDRDKPVAKFAYLLRSHSVLYCAVPKIATRTLLTIVLYLHFQEMSNCLTNDCTKIGFPRISINKLLNRSALVTTLPKGAAAMLKAKEPLSLADLLRLYVLLFQQDGTNTRQLPTSPNSWMIQEGAVLPYLHLRSFQNWTHLFSPAFLRVLFVRHPFDRLASAYIDKIVTSQKDVAFGNPKYDELRQQICREYQSYNVSSDWSEIEHPCKEFVPPFEHFLDYVLREDPTSRRSNVHWRSSSKLCDVCTMKYNFIGKYETMDDDLMYFLSRLNLSNWDARRRRGSSYRTKWQYQQMFSRLSNQLICRLRHAYEEDFRLFDYRLEDYVHRPLLSCTNTPN